MYWVKTIFAAIVLWCVLIIPAAACLGPIGVIVLTAGVLGSIPGAKRADIERAQRQELKRREYAKRLHAVGMKG